MTHPRQKPLKNHNTERCNFQMYAFLTLLGLFFLTAAVIEVQMMRGDLQPTRHHSHDCDELTVFRQNQFLFLILVFSFPSESSVEGIRLNAAFLYILVLI